MEIVKRIKNLLGISRGMRTNPEAREDMLLVAFHMWQKNSLPRSYFIRPANKNFKFRRIK